jgi:hypothetical protein
VASSRSSCWRRCFVRHTPAPPPDLLASVPDARAGTIRLHSPSLRNASQPISNGCPMWSPSFVALVPAAAGLGDKRSL